MTRKLRARTPLFLALIAASTACIAVACDSSDDSTGGTTDLTDSGSGDGAVAADSHVATDSSTAKDTGTSNDAGTDGTVNTGDSGMDGSTDATVDTGTDSAVPTGCAAFPNADFCDDFDNAGAITTGTTKWDFLEDHSTQPVLALSTAQAVSAPNSLLTQIIDGSSPGAQFNKNLTKANLSDITWDYDVFVESAGNSDGFFLDDLQFTTNNDFGFRLVLFSAGAADAGSTGDFRVEHNGDKVGDAYDIEPNFPADTLKIGQWSHFTQNAKFTFAGDAGTDSVQYTLSIDGTQVFQKSYKGLARADLSMAHVAGMALVFNKDHSAGTKIYWDNQVVTIK